MATNQAVPPPRAPKLFCGVVRALAAVIFCVLVRYSHAFCFAYNTPYSAAKQNSQTAVSLREFSVFADTTDPDYMQDYIPQRQTEGNLTRMSNSRLVLYYEIVVLFFALPIAIGALVCGDTRASAFPRSTSEKRPFPTISDQVMR